MGFAPDGGRRLALQILASFLGFAGTFFWIPGLYRQANTRPAGRPPSDWPDFPERGKKGGGTTWPASLFIFLRRTSWPPAK